MHCQTLTLSSQPHVASCSATQHSTFHASTFASEPPRESVWDMPKPQISKKAALDPAMLHTTSPKYLRRSCKHKGNSETHHAAECIYHAKPANEAPAPLSARFVRQLAPMIALRGSRDITSYYNRECQRAGFSHGYGSLSTYLHPCSSLVLNLAHDGCIRA